MLWLRTKAPKESSVAKIVLGMGTSHGPMLSTPPDGWGLRVPADRVNKHHFKGRTWTFDELVEARRGERLDKEITQDVWNRRHAECRAAIAELARVFAEVKPDVAVIVGNDQYEIIKKALQPAFSVFWGQDIVNNEWSEARIAQLPPGIAVGLPGHIPPGGATYRGLPDLGEHIIKSAVADAFDVTSLTEMTGGETPHAFGFVYRQIMGDAPVPNVPIILNTFFPPNQPTVGRCYDFGKAIVRAIESWDADTRVALIASGGLTHFVIDEEVDRTLLDAMKKGSIEDVAALGEPIFQAGTSEVKNWVPVAGAMANLGFEPTIVDYVPCYRSEAGTGNAMGFVYWRP
jgi:3-O-methylgallate 3,4-dioxygenase